VFSSSRKILLDNEDAANFLGNRDAEMAKRSLYEECCGEGSCSNEEVHETGTRMTAQEVSIIEHFHIVIFIHL